MKLSLTTILLNVRDKVTELERMNGGSTGIRSSVSRIAKGEPTVAASQISMDRTTCTRPRKNVAGKSR